MKTREVKLVEHSGNLVADQRTRFSITKDQQALSFLMASFIDLYSRPDEAAIHEPATNAFDSHQEAGNPAPIEIELPSALDHTYVVRDHGVGMSPDDVANVYGQYGYSTKRGTDEQVGLFGLGSKAPLTYANQFSLVATKDGVTTTALILREEDGAGAIQILDESFTAKPSGVEIRIPVKDWRSFTEKATTFFSFWTPGTVLVNGEQPVCIFDKHLTLDEDVVIVRGDDLDDNYIVMGNVAYSCGYERLLTNRDYNTHVAVRVEIGSVDFTPSREALQFTPRTKEVIATARDYIDEHLQRHVQGEITNASSPREALKVYDAWKSVLRLNNVRYNNEELPSSVSMKGFAWHPGYRRASKTTYISRERIVSDDTVLVLDHPVRSFNAETREKLQETYPDANYYFAVSSLDTSKAQWLTGTEQVSYSDLMPPKERQPRGPRGPKQAPKVEVISQHSAELVDLESLEGAIVYLQRNQCTPRLTKEQYRNQVVDWVGDTATVALVPSVLVDRFLKRYPQAVTPTQWLQRDLARVEALVSDDAIAYAGSSYGLGVALARLNVNEILDPEVSAIAERARAAQAGATLVNRRAKLLSVLETTPRPRVASDLIDKARQIYAAYPKLSSYGAKLESEDIEYINALYYFRQEFSN